MSNHQAYGTADLGAALGGMPASHVRRALYEGNLPEPDRRQPRIEWHQPKWDLIMGAVRSVSIPVDQLRRDHVRRPARELARVMPVQAGSILRLACLGRIGYRSPWSPSEIVQDLEFLRASRMVRVVELDGSTYVAPYSIMPVLRDAINHGMM